VPGLPTVFEVYKKVHGKEMSGPAGRALKAMFTIRVMAGKMMMLPKNTRPDILKAYRAAARKIVNDPVFTSKKGKKVVGPYPQSLEGEALRIRDQASVLDPEARTWLLKWLKSRFGTELNKKKKS